jgi:hypothetical protein
VPGEVVIHNNIWGARRHAHGEAIYHTLYDNPEDERTPFLLQAADWQARKLSSVCLPSRVTQES